MNLIAPEFQQVPDGTGLLFSRDAINPSLGGFAAAIRAAETREKSNPAPVDYSAED